MKEDWNNWIELLKGYTKESHKVLDESKIYLDSVTASIWDLDKQVKDIFEKCWLNLSSDTKKVLDWVKNEVLELLMNLYVLNDDIRENTDKTMECVEQWENTIKLFHEKLNRDKLTWLYNWDFFDKKLELYFLEDKEFNLIFIDLDNLKFINDNYWHNIWDDIIKEFAKNLNLIFWESKNELFRIHWDEFTIISFDSIDEINRKIGKLITWLSNRKFLFIHNWKNLNHKIWFSYWVSEKKESSNSEELYRLADSRMYENKKDRKIKRW